MRATGTGMRTARSQRRTMSLPEVLLWRLLRRSPGGVKFRRQHAMGSYAADFYCAAAKLVIEIDGQAHLMGDRPARDEARDSWLRAQGVQILRIPALDVLKDAAGVADSLVRHCSRGGGPSTTQLR